MQPLGILLQLLLASPLGCFQSPNLQQMDLLEAQQKLVVRRIWNLWEILTSESFEQSFCAALNLLDDLNQKQRSRVTISRARPTPKPPTIHPYGTWSLCFTWCAVKQIANLPLYLFWNMDKRIITVTLKTKSSSGKKWW